MTAADRGPSVKTTPEMRRILDLEDAEPAELFEILPGSTVPFWAQVRMQIAWALSESVTGSVAVETDNWTRWGEARRLAKAFLPNRSDAARRARRHDVLFYVGGGTVASAGGRTRNWLVDDFAEATPSALVVQRRPLPSPLGPPAFRPTLSMEPTTARARLWARGYAPPAATVAAIDRLLGCFAQQLDLQPSQIGGIRRRVLRTEAHRPHELAELRRMVRRVRPRVVIMDTASYTYNGETVGVFKDAGAYVAEPQHGWIGPSHAAYNYGRAFEHPALRRALPDELLTFGEFWSEGVTIPARKTAIGKPHLERLATAAPRVRKRQLLVISSRAEPDETDRFVEELRGALSPDWRVVFRPHPGEREVVDERYPRIAAHPGISIDEAPDVYATLADTHTVIGVASTVLFEAVAFGCHVIPRDSAFSASVIGDAFGPRISSVAQAVRRLEASDQISQPSVREVAPDTGIWATGSTDAYRRWLADRIGPPTR